MKKVVMMVLAVVSFSIAYSDVSAIIAPVGDTLKDPKGDVVSMADGMFMLIADIEGDGLDGYNFGGVSDLNLTDMFAQDDDILFYSGGFAGDDVGFGSFTQQVYAGLELGQEYYAVWSVGTGWAGTHRIDGDVNWEVPPSGGTVSPSYSGYGSPNTQYASVPEPATALLLVLGAGCAWMGRRAKRFHNSEA